jgi:hypothetical protein
MDFLSFLQVLASDKVEYYNQAIGIIVAGFYLSFVFILLLDMAYVEFSMEEKHHLFDSKHP